MEYVFLASLYILQEPSATVLPFWKFRFKQIQNATGKSKVDVKAAKLVHLQKSLLRWSVSRCKISLERLSREVRMQENGREDGFMFIPSCTHRGFL